MDREIPASVRWWSIVRNWALTLLALGAGLWLVGWAIGLLEPRARRSQIRIGTVERGPIEAVLDAAGVVAPAAERVIPSLVDGRILRVLEQPGALLAEGDPILELDVVAATLEVGRLEDDLAQSRGERLELRLQQEEKLAELASQEKLRRLDLDQLAYEVAQQERLFAEGLVAETQLRATQLRRSKAEVEIEQLREKVAKSHESLAAQLAQLDARQATLRRNLEDARTKAAMAIVRADRPGVLTFVAKELGIRVGAGDPLARIADPNRFRVEATLSEVHAPKLAEAQQVRVPIAQEVLTGRVSRVLPAVEGGAVRFDVALEESDSPLLRPNLRVEVLVVTDHRDDVLTLAKGPFASGPGVQSVFVVRGERALQRRVRLGLSGHRRWEVLEGLELGEEVIVSDTSRFRDQAEIRVSP